MSSLQISRADARVAALSGLIDYAGLFPPESLDMDGAVAGYRSARAHEHAWMVDRFICPATRLEELAAVLVPTMTGGEEPWRLTVIGDAVDAEWLGGVDADSLAMATFDAEMSGGVAIEVVEKAVPVGGVAEESVIEALRRYGRPTYFEVPWEDDGAEMMLATLARARVTSGRALGAKMRVGGRTAGSFPPPRRVAAFITACRDLALPLKATAGLHHPFRHREAETGFIRHGFVNLLMASALSHDGLDEAVLIEVLSDEDPSSFALDRAGMSWRDHRVGAAALAEMRRSLFVGYGSCSFDEPVDDLTALGVLPVSS
jgi:hypothetical protein